MVCVRFLRTQQRVKNRCQVLPRRIVSVLAGLVGVGVVCDFYPLVDNEQQCFLLVVCAQLVI